jgi:dihydroneopterin aldolase
MSQSRVRQAVWDAGLVQSGYSDRITVQNLQVTANAGTDVWGRKKAQPALITVTVTLAQQFASASSTDTVDNSTIHYGTLSKAVKAHLQELSSTWISTAHVLYSIHNTVANVADRTPFFAIETSICLPKASMFGDAIVYSESRTSKDEFGMSSVLHLRNIRIPCVIGVNSNERLQKQPVVVNLWVECIHGDRVDDYAQLETLLFNVSYRRPP